MRVLFIYRAPEFSPNNVQSDAAILDAVASRLQMLGAALERCDEADLPDNLDDYDLILHMARRSATLIRLSRLHHALVINSPSGVSLVSSSRSLTLQKLSSIGVSVPAWTHLSPESMSARAWRSSCNDLLPGWLKVMRSEGALPNDVSYVETALELEKAISLLPGQHLTDVVLTKHVEGDLIKCYYVASSSHFLRWFYPKETGYSKYGWAEQHNSDLARIPFQESQIQAMSKSISSSLGLQIFGFDAIVHPLSPGENFPRISVIDVNDWPSFGICRLEAAEAIGRLFNMNKNADI